MAMNELPKWYQQILSQCLFQAEAQQALVTYPQALATTSHAQQANYHNNETPLAEYRRQEWRRTVSRNWLNAMLDIELSLG